MKPLRALAWFCLLACWIGALVALIALVAMLTITAALVVAVRAPRKD